MPVIVVKKRKLNVPKSSKPKKKRFTVEERKVKLVIELMAQRKRRWIKWEKEREETRAIFLTLAEKWPRIFSPEAPTVPLKIGIRNDVIAALPEYKTQKIRSVLKHYFNLVRGEYLRMLAAGGPRFDLDGNECGVITEKERGVALAQLGKSQTTLDKV